MFTVKLIVEEASPDNTDYPTEKNSLHNDGHSGAKKK